MPNDLTPVPAPTLLEPDRRAPRGPFRLAHTPWPMHGHDPARSGRSPLVGPRRGAVSAGVLRKELEPLGPAPQFVTLDERRLAVVGGGRLLTTVGDELMYFGDVARGFGSPPLALEGGGLACIAGGYLAIATVGDAELTLHRHRLPALDDTPVTHDLSLSVADGELVFGSVGGALCAFDGDAFRVIADGLGYDILTPTVLPGGSLVFSAYTGTGVTCLGPGGAEEWSVGSGEYDTMVSYHRGGVIACSSLDLAASVLARADGTLVRTIPGGVGVWSELSDDAWLVRTPAGLTARGLHGDELWHTPWKNERRNATVDQPVVDAESYSYAMLGDGVACFRPDGALQFHAAVGPVSCIGLTAAGELTAVGAAGILRLT